MLSRSTKLAGQRQAILSPLSPLSSPPMRFAPMSTKVQPRLQKLRSTRRHGKYGSRLQISLPSSPRSLSPTTATALGFDTSLMERLENVLASPFSPKTFARTIISPPPPPPPVVKPVASRPSGLKPRRKAPPTMLSLPEPPRNTAQTPLSPFKYPIVAARGANVVVSPTIVRQVSPITTLTDAQIRSQKMEKLARCLGESVPPELVYPSIGEVAEKAKMGSYLELYRTGSGDDSSVGMKSPAPKDAHWEAVGMGKTTDREQHDGSRKRAVRRSRSLGDFYTVTDIREMRSLNDRLAQREGAMKTVEHSPTDTVSVSSTSGTSTTEPDGVAVLKRKRSIANAKAVIIGTDAKLMALFRQGFNAAAPPAPVPVSSTSTPSSDVPSALLSIQSPRAPAPYWVKTVDPKTPRTLRTERRMGWGGPWNHGSMGEMMDKLKEL
ncbi:hypothetical protein BXZ70DRAFT_1068740 [Cristinia sonorae]|uniref:Uncharacterized protein n=1 Tax=Cristinia sonorae TaxID=1940300 RepID=A0A8K0XKE0_9AGAR|nr:hypothetical protein BXZ70DRAFT_1068740 [Cristinia sonorae]